jgi:hypothetical protein
MATSKASVTEVSRNFSEYINRVAYGNDKYILVRGGKDLAELRPCGTVKVMSELAGILSSLPKLSDEDLGDFESDVKDLRKSIEMEKGSAWDA